MLLSVRTERLQLVALTRDQLLLALRDTELLAQDLGIELCPEVFSEESRQAMSIKVTRMEHIDAHLHPWYTYFLIIQAEERRALGVCGFKGAPTPYGTVEVGYGIHEAVRNKGYMTETVRALIEWAFQQEACRRVTAETLRDNYPSQRVLQKSGLRLERESQNMIYWKVEKEDWKPIASSPETS
jgi:[ribosomal protein S5]-alanine N-acetyltransferase